jgi:predicted nucleotidyltransferase
MLEIFNTLGPFFEDNYRRINVREYARLQKISPPTASKLLSSLKKEGLINQEEDRQFIYYYANKSSNIFIDLSRIYWKAIIQNSGLFEEITKNFLNPIIILFGSLSKAEVKASSDIDLAIITPTKKELQINKFEKALNRKIQIFKFSTKEEIKSKELLNNILNGYKIAGEF